jgi:DNA-binding PadR family transcriptional regulator
LTKLEELVLLAILKLDNDAYGITIYKYVQNVTGKKMSVGSVYFPLDRLTQRGLLTAFQGEPTPKRGGMSKRYYKISQKGFDALKETKKINDTMWDSYSEESDSTITAY